MVDFKKAAEVQKIVDRYKREAGEQLPDDATHAWILRAALSKACRALYDMIGQRDDVLRELDQAREEIQTWAKRYEAAVKGGGNGE